jgi:hypothetical protein
LNRLSVAGDVGMFKACREMTLERWLSAFGIEKEQKRKRRLNAEKAHHFLGQSIENGQLVEAVPPPGDMDYTFAGRSFCDAPGRVAGCGRAGSPVASAITAAAEPGELEHQLGGETGALVRLSDGTVVLYRPHPAQLARLYEDGLCCHGSSCQRLLLYAASGGVFVLFCRPPMSLSDTRKPNQTTNHHQSNSRSAQFTLLGEGNTPPTRDKKEARCRN